MTELTAQTLPALRDHLSTPGYDRSALRVGIVHLGVGGFHRAHQAMYLDRLMNQGLALDWAICGVGVLPADSRMRAALQAQDGLYTLVRKSADGTYDARVIGSIVEYLLAPDDPERVIERMTDPLVRIVSLTVTEGGYNINAVTGKFAATAADVVHDLAPGAVPRTTFGNGRPPWEDAGVQLVDDVEPYELMKLRLLNASHQALCYFGYLAGYRLVHEVAQDPLFAGFLLDYMDSEATPTLAPVPGIDLTAYKHELIERFSNAEVRDTVARLCAESSDRIPKWLLPVIRHNVAGGEIRRSAAVVASWARYAEGVDEQGQPIDDPLSFLR